MPTIHDGKIHLWHWKGDSLRERTIEDAVRSIKQSAPHAKGIMVKTLDGTDWMARWDTASDLAISGTQSIMRWVQVLEANGMEFHAWCVPKGEKPEQEADLIIESCLVRGVKSLTLDVEPYPGFWQVGASPIKPFMTRIRRGLGGDFHIGISVDPRPHHYTSIYPSEWKPFMNSVHPQCYWALFERPLQEVLDETYRIWDGYGLPIYPVLQGNAPANEVGMARDYAVRQHQATGLSWWRLGVIDAPQFAQINKPMTEVEPPPDNAPLGGRYGIEIVVAPGDPRFAIGTHNGQPVSNVFKTHQSTWGWTSYYAPTATNRSIGWARWDPRLSESGWYEVAVFTPARHANTCNSRYKLHGAQGEVPELSLPIEQCDYKNLWVPLGIYQFDANNPQAGIVFLNDLTGEIGREISFDAIRYRQIIGHTPGNASYMADGYDAPIGTTLERASDTLWAGNWFDATGYGAIYLQGTPQEAYHTGADLNLNTPFFDADAHSPVYACATGVVTYAGRLPGWGNIIIIRHDPLITTGAVMFSRYAHVENIRIQLADRVQRGQMIASVGNAEGAFPFHLHFDLSPTNILETAPWDWPRLNMDLVRRNYVDPRAFIAANRPVL